MGDKVKDAVPGARGTESHTVAKVIVTTTDHDFVDLTLAATKATSVLGRKAVALAAGVAALAGAAATLTTTFHHPFYDQTKAAFVEAADLSVGDTLQTPTGTAVVEAKRTYHTNAVTYDLTIAGLHTYYVLAGTTPVLVHNCGTTDLYRVSPMERGTAELDHGLNPEHFPSVGPDGEELTGAAHFGNGPRVNDFASSHAGTHGQGFKVTVPNRWLTDNNIEIWEGRTPDQLEYLVPNDPDLMGEFNQFPRESWTPGKPTS